MSDVRVKVLKRFNDLAAGSETHLDAAVAAKWEALGLLEIINPQKEPEASADPNSLEPEPGAKAAEAPPESEAAKAPKVRK